MTRAYMTLISLINQLENRSKNISYILSLMFQHKFSIIKKKYIEKKTKHAQFKTLMK